MGRGSDSNTLYGHQEPRTPRPSFIPENGGLIVSSGTEAVHNPSLAAAKANMKGLVKDLGAGEFKRLEAEDYQNKYEDGRYAFTLLYDTREYEIQMPGLPLSEVRYLGEPGQDIFAFPRLYVDGNSWVWEIALIVLKDPDE